MNTRAGAAPVDAYEWRQLKGPPLRFFAEQKESVRVWAFLEMPGAYHLILRARNERGWCPFAPLEFEVEEDPERRAGPDFLMPVGFGEKLVLSGEGWKQVYGEAVELRRAEDGSETVVRLVKPGLFLFEALHAGDIPERHGYWLPSDKDGVLGDRRPEAKVPATLWGVVGQPLTVDGGLSRDPDGDPLTARWIRSEEEDLKQTDEKGLAAVFVASKPGNYRLQLVVSDGRLEALAECYVEFREAGDQDPAYPALPDLPQAEAWPAEATVGLYESDLDRAVQVLPARGGVTLRVAQEFHDAARLSDIPLHLAVRDGPTRLALDWIARQAGGWYVRDGERDVWLVGAGRTVREDPLTNVVLPVDALYAEGKDDEFLKLLLDCFAGVLKQRRDSSITVESKTKQVIAFLPRTASDRLKEVLFHLRTPKGLGLPPPLPLDVEARRMRLVLEQKKLTLERTSRRLDLLLRDLGDLAGVQVGFDPREFGVKVYSSAAFTGKLPRLTVKFEGPLRQVVRDLCAAAGFDGCQVEAGGGLWFYKGAAPYPYGGVALGDGDRAQLRTLHGAAAFAAAERRGGGARGPEARLSGLLEGPGRGVHLPQGQRAADRDPRGRGAGAGA
ncbi:MAG: PKD domain-containing protein [Planctomycetota bacterium]|nr:PKD domain-containing protein [Planctomycetota bacterium]